MDASDLAYRHPVLYDLEYSALAADIDHYVALAKMRGGPVLELGVGNGRIALPLARANIEVHGVDRSETMLADFKRKVSAEPINVQARIRMRQGDFRYLNGPRSYRTVFLPFNAVHHCTHHSDVQALLSSVDSVLLPGGRFYLDCYLPDPILHGRDPNQQYGHTDFAHPITGQNIHSWEQSWYDPIAQIHHVHYTYVPEGEAPVEVKLDLRVFHYQEMLALLDWGGFRIAHEAGGFDGRDVTAKSSKWILCLERKPSS